MTKPYYRYWGKAKSDNESGPDYHLLPYHSLDVAAVGWYLLDPEKPLCQQLADQLGVEAAWLRDFFVFALALHDLGKFANAFQGLKQGQSDELVKANSTMYYTERHDTLGFRVWKDYLGKAFANNYRDQGAQIKTLEPWMEIVTGHHGMPPKKSGNRIGNFFTQEDQKAAGLFLQHTADFLLTDFDFSPLSDKAVNKGLKTLSWQLAGVAVLADWQGSNQTHFAYCSEPLALSDYWQKQALPAAAKAMQAIPEKPKTRAFQGISDLFSFIEKPTPLQEYATKEPLSKQPQLFILEDVTGAGKTEAALILAHRLLGQDLADGLYVALPTMATANAMYERLGKVYQRFYRSGEQPSIVLAHGARKMSAAFQQSICLAEQKEDHSYAESHAVKEQDLSATLYCNAWLADTHKKALLADIGVGTLDQALLTVLPARHQSLRMLGLHRKILLVDEVHAYDVYMQALLDSLLEMHARQGGSVILLSATLPQTMRQKLVAAFHRGLGHDTVPALIHRAYPLATHIPAMANKERETPLETRDAFKRTVQVTRLDSEADVMARIQQAVQQGQCVCWIRNTVKAARHSYADLSAFDCFDAENLHLFHSRFAMIDRQNIEADTLERFGDQSTPEQRHGQVLIATQVVEQSLDLDFDVLITDLAPIDLIIQRVGRLQRHCRDAQGQRLRQLGSTDQRGMPVLYLLAPEASDAADGDWLKHQQAGTKYVYPHLGQLWLTVKQLLDDKQGKLVMPDDARALIEGVYGEAVMDAFPADLQAASGEAEGTDMVRQSMAHMNVLTLKKGYTRSSGDWDEDTRIPTRLSEQETVPVALARLVGGVLQPYAEGMQHTWALSTVNLPEHEWQQAKQHIPESVQALIDSLTKEVKVLRWTEVFPLMDDTAHYYSPKHGWQPGTGEKQ